MGVRLGNAIGQNIWELESICWGVGVEKVMVMWGEGEDDTKGRVDLQTTDINHLLGWGRVRSLKNYSPTMICSDESFWCPDCQFRPKLVYAKLAMFWHAPVRCPWATGAKKQWKLFRFICTFLGCIDVLISQLDVVNHRDYDDLMCTIHNCIYRMVYIASPADFSTHPFSTHPKYSQFEDHGSGHLNWNLFWQADMWIKESENIGILSSVEPWACPMTRLFRWKPNPRTGSPLRPKVCTLSVAVISCLGLLRLRAVF